MRQDRRHTVEEENTPEHLPGRLGQGLCWILSFSRSQTSQLSPTEGESSRDEHGAEALEAVTESTGVVPISGTNVTARIG